MQNFACFRIIEREPKKKTAKEGEIAQMKFQKIEKDLSYKDRIYNALKEAIITNDLKAGQMINERSLSEQFGISRTPIREALKSLENDGWIATEPFCGTWVKKIETKDLTDIFQMRLALEPLAIELAMKNIINSEEKELTTIVQNQIHASSKMNPLEFTKADLEFHLFINHLSGNALLIKTLSGFMDFMSRYLIQTIRRVQPYDIPLQEHQAILDGILQKDVAAAKEAVTLHIQRAYITATENIEKN
jgi:DNA-binding GntR family transcriptional regulator